MKRAPASVWYKSPSALNANATRPPSGWRRRRWPAALAESEATRRTTPSRRPTPCRSDVAKHGVFRRHGRTVCSGVVSALDIKQGGKFRFSASITFPGDDDRMVELVLRRAKRPPALQIPVVLHDGLIDILHRIDDGPFIPDKRLMRPHFLDVDERVETTEIEQRPIGARTKRPDRPVDLRHDADTVGSPGCPLSSEAGGQHHRGEQHCGRRPGTFGRRREFALGRADIRSPPQKFDGHPGTQTFGKRGQAGGSPECSVDVRRIGAEQPRQTPLGRGNLVGDLRLPCLQEREVALRLNED
jgi:hypothetical protein